MLASEHADDQENDEETPMDVVRIEDQHAVYEFEGEVIAGGPDCPVTTALDARQRRRARWMEAVLYIKPDKTYVLWQVNYSLVWHLIDGGGHVRKPVQMPWSQLDRDAVYCGALPTREGRESCPPGPRRGPKGAGRTILAELPQHRVSSHPDHHAVIRAVTLAQRGDGSMSAALSEPMNELLRQARLNDPAFRGGAKPVVRM
jgi:hypothetical protein